MTGGHDAMTWMGDIPTAATRMHSPLKGISFIQFDQWRSSYQGSMTKLLMQNNTLFRKLEDKHLEEHRHDDPRLQREYDKRFGLVLKR